MTRVAPVLGVELRRHTRRAGEVTEHDGDRTALGSIGTGHDRGRSLRLARLHGRGAGDGGDVELLDRGHDFPPVPDDSDAEVLQVVERQLRQHRAVDLIVPERRLILPKAKVPEPDPDIHRCSLKRAARPMMVPRGRGVHGVGPE